MKVISIENIIDIQDFIKFVNKTCKNKQEIIEQRIETLACDYALNHDCKVEFKDSDIYFFPEEMLTLPCIF